MGKIQEKNRDEIKFEKEYKKFIKDFLKLPKPNLILKISNLHFDVSACDDEEYQLSQDELKHITNIVNHLSKNIFIDKTYVKFEGNRWKDAYIVEDKWYELIKIIVGSNLGRNKYGKISAKECSGVILESVILLSIEYMYRTLANMGFDTDLFVIDIKQHKHNFGVEYEFDSRDDWRF